MPTLEPMRLQIPVNEALVIITICDDDVSQLRKVRQCAPPES
jgi:hypothetical protein